MADDRLTAPDGGFYEQMAELERQALEEIGAFDAIAELDEEAVRREEIESGEESPV